MSEVDLHRCLLMLLDLIGLLHVELDWLAGLLLPICIEDVVRIIFAQHKTSITIEHSQSLLSEAPHRQHQLNTYFCKKLKNSEHMRIPI